MDRTELAWAAGFWDGEGSAYLSGARARATRHPQARINQASDAGVPDVLVRFQGAVGFGRVQGPDLVEGREPLYKWIVSDRAACERVAELLVPWLGEVKRRQFELVNGRRLAAGHWARLPIDEKYAWLAGLWDGEGSVCLLKHRTHMGYFVGEANVTQSSAAGQPEVLTRIGLIANGGHIFGPFEQKRAVLPIYKWRMYRLADMRMLFETMWPWLGDVKRAQCASVLAVLDGQRPLPRGNPAWGSHKTHCLRGHAYATARIRPFRGRGKNTAPPRASHQCLACVREWHRARRVHAAK